jgi:hypothetical protein
MRQRNPIVQNQYESRPFYASAGGRSSAGGAAPSAGGASAGGASAGGASPAGAGAPPKPSRCALMASNRASSVRPVCFVWEGRLQQMEKGLVYREMR